VGDSSLVIIVIVGLLGSEILAISPYWLEVTVLGPVSLNIKPSTRVLMINETAVIIAVKDYMLLNPAFKRFQVHAKRKEMKRR